MIAALLAIALAANTGTPVVTEHGIPQRGVASWYDATRNNAWYTRGGTRYYAAVGTFRWGDDPYAIKICRKDQPRTCVIATVVDYCERCARDLKRPWDKRSRSVDLSPAAFAALRGLNFGVVQVILTELTTGK
jgi:hypothetical protein